MSTLTALAALITAATAALAWHRRASTRTAATLVVTLLGVTAWAAAQTVLSSAAPSPAVEHVVLLQYLGIGATVVGLRLFVDAVAGRRWSRARLGLLLVEPVLVLVLLAVGPWSHLVHAAVVQVPDGAGGHERSTTPGPAFWAHTAYSYAVLLSAGLDVHRLRRTATGVLRRQAGTMLVAMTVPFAVNLVHVLSPGRSEDATPVAFAASGLLLAFSVLRQDLLRLLPVARSLVVDTVTDAVLVLDATGRVVDRNPAAVALAGHLDSPSTPTGQRLEDGGGHLGRALAEAVGHGEGQTVLDLAPGTSLDVRARWIRDDRDHVLGRLVVVRDVSDTRRQQRQLEEVNEQLHAHVATIERLRADLAEEAARDPLTGLRNRRRFVDDLAARLRAAAPTGTPLALALLDVDHFKAVNDDHGHAVGDQVLVAVGRALRRHARAEDVVRYGGEEFVVLLPGCDPPAAAERAEALRRACGAVRVEHEAVTVTVSAGVACAPHHGGTADELLLAADRALYAAKAAGRDRVSVAS